MDIHPPQDAAMVLLKRFGDWKFPAIAGIITTPTLRPDGTILSAPGYDPATQTAAGRSAADAGDPGATHQGRRAGGAGAAQGACWSSFPSSTTTARSVALSAQISTVCRGAYPMVPMHVIDAPVAGSGKSYLLSTVSWIATGQAMPVIGAGKNEEELEKRLGAAVIQGQPLDLHRQRGRRARRQATVPADRATATERPRSRPVPARRSRSPQRHVSSPTATTSSSSATCAGGWSAAASIRGMERPELRAFKATRWRKSWPIAVPTSRRR